METKRSLKILISHPSPDLYGSDLQLLETIEGLTHAGHAVHVALPASGPLETLIAERGGVVKLVKFPVSRKSLLSPRGLPKYFIDTFISLFAIWRMMRAIKPEIVYANTLTTPVWFLAAKLYGVPLVCHVHEAEESARKSVALLLTVPLLLCNAVIVNSKASRQVIEMAVPRLRSRIKLIYNGIPHSGQKPAPVGNGFAGQTRVVMVGRLSPRKGTDVALEAVAKLVQTGNDVSLTLCGDIYPGYEWFAAELERRANAPDLQGRINFAGYRDDVANQLALSEVVIVPSLTEPFGNVAVEAQLANRPVVASNVQGLAEIITDGSTGILSEPGNPSALADAISKLMTDRDQAQRMADAAYASATRRFSVARYQADIVELSEQTASGNSTGGIRRAK
ncbi:glycosyltransferase family 4 protein [Rhodococcus sp. G-MC3]|uniref:glycosyltransferase family 4 protein n=1 Tax=Rhodococcus sp. G-MC3 TaxID=3046209 RepID=UPI0024B93027|nr:glycosyltransferase family 4 protein [Rhodococcus sp. G-MC3]MDJ0396363.1 glycosyltransferase family 4 protein [Rhodococcus sp. G-MC3]